MSSSRGTLMGVRASCKQAKRASHVYRATDHLDTCDGPRLPPARGGEADEDIADSRFAVYAASNVVWVHRGRASLPRQEVGIRAIRDARHAGSRHRGRASATDEG